MRTTTLALCILAASSLAAQAVRINGGVQVGLGLPTGDFADKKDINGDYLGANDGLGIHFGGHLDLNFTQHHQLRLIANINGFASKKQDIYTGGYYDGTQQNSFGIAQIGADYVYNAGSPSHGGYFLAGLNLNQVKVKYEFSNYIDSEVTKSGRVGFRVGGGYNFTRIFSLEGHLNSVSVDKSEMGYDAITWLSVSAVFRFGRP